MFLLWIIGGLALSFGQRHIWPTREDTIWSSDAVYSRYIIIRFLWVVSMVLVLWISFTFRVNLPLYWTCSSSVGIICFLFDIWEWGKYCKVLGYSHSQVRFPPSLALKERVQTFMQSIEYRISNSWQPLYNATHPNDIYCSFVYDDI